MGTRFIGCWLGPSPPSSGVAVRMEGAVVLTGPHPEQMPRRKVRVTVANYAQARDANSRCDATTHQFFTHCDEPPKWVVPKPAISGHR